MWSWPYFDRSGNRQKLLGSVLLSYTTAPSAGGIIAGLKLFTFDSYFQSFGFKNGLPQ